MRILIADDDVTSRSILAAVLKRWGYEVTAVKDGSEALASMEAPGAPKLAILDWMMPGLDGVAVCRRLRAEQSAEPPYLVLLTARDKLADLVTGLEAGANDYLAKPFDNDELRARLGVGTRVIELQALLAGRIADLQHALSHIKRLQGIIPICMYCGKIRRTKESWQRLEEYVTEHAEAKFSHSICEECFAKHHPE